MRISTERWNARPNCLPSTERLSTLIVYIDCNNPQPTVYRKWFELMVGIKQRQNIVLHIYLTVACVQSVCSVHCVWCVYIYILCIAGVFCVIEWISISVLIFPLNHSSVCLVSFRLQFHFVRLFAIYIAFG